jgi:hypothetical protein
MAKYVVTYTIGDDTKREEFVKSLESVGLKKFDDQSVNYGSYDPVKNGNLVKFLTEKSTNLTKDDVVYLFKGNIIPNNQKTIELVTIFSSRMPKFHT